VSRPDSAVQIAPSLLASDYAYVGHAIEVLEGHADVFHVDVMDGHFVPNISPMAPGMVKRLRQLTATPLDVHLMVDEPERWVEPYRAAGADWISVHAEATVHLERLVARIRELGARAGVVLNPATPFAGLEYALAASDFVLVMSVNPGFGGQGFLPRTPEKIRALRAHLDAHDLQRVDIEVDGGVDVATAGICTGAGARVLVAGSSILGSDDPVRAARELRAAAGGAG
jgi:ribulose-phosphate 3-epimerase